MSDSDMDDSAKSSAQADAAAMHVALGGASDEARDYLRKQRRLADLQIENLQKLDEFETSHLRWRRFNDQMKGALLWSGNKTGAQKQFATAAVLSLAPPEKSELSWVTHG